MSPVEKCTLNSAIKAAIDGKMYCLNEIGESTYSSAEAKCRSLNAKLPMPRSSKENSDLMKALTGMGLNPDWQSGTPVILGMVDSALGSAIGKYFS